MPVDRGGRGSGVDHPHKHINTRSAERGREMSRSKSARVFSNSENAAKRARFSRSMSMAAGRERRRSAMGEYIGERPLSAACK